MYLVGNEGKVDGVKKKGGKYEKRLIVLAAKTQCVE